MTSARLNPFFDSGLLGTTEKHLIRAVARLSPKAGELTLLALGIASRGARHGHTCIDLAEVDQINWSQSATDDDRRNQSELLWPDPDQWSADLISSPIVASPSDAESDPIRPLVFDGQRIYLQRYWTHEVRVAEDLIQRATRVDTPDGLSAVLDSLFPESDDHPVDMSQRQAVEMALSSGLSIITGGPGTGKTFTIARILAGARQLTGSQSISHRVALAAPTGKAAARITESLAAALDSIDDSEGAFGDTEATTIHALLGWAPGDGFRHNRRNPLPYDMVIVDETSMVSLSLMARLLEAVAPDASLVLVGDPDQLASVEVGTVLSDIIGPENRDPSDIVSKRVTVLTNSHRFGDQSSIAHLATAIRSGNTQGAVDLLSSDDPSISWIKPADTAAVGRLIDEVVDASVLVAQAALDGDAISGIDAAMSTKVLSAIHMRRHGLQHWSELVEEAVARKIPDLQLSRRWYVGRPVMITANDRVNRVANGDIGLVVSHDDSIVVALPDANEIRYLPTSRLSDATTWWAMTIHKSQGSEFDHVVVSLPPAGSPVLSRELIYTAVTRARSRVTILADETTLREAISTSITRASGLRSRLVSAT